MLNQSRCFFYKHPDENFVQIESVDGEFCIRKFFAGKVFKTPQHLQKNFFRAGGSLIILSCEIDFRQDLELTSVAQLYNSDVISDTDIFSDVSFETRFHEFKYIGVVITRGIFPGRADEQTAGS